MSPLPAADLMAVQSDRVKSKYAQAETTSWGKIPKAVGKGFDMKRLFPRLLLLIAIAAFSASGPAQVAPKNGNEHVVVDFYNLAFNAHEPAEAAKLYIGNTYIQHNPHVANGAAAFVSHFEVVSSNRERQNR